MQKSAPGDFMEQECMGIVLNGDQQKFSYAFYFWKRNLGFFFKKDSPNENQK